MKPKRGTPYSKGMRSQIVAVVEAGASCREVATQYGVSTSAVRKWTLRYRRTGSISAKPAGGDRTTVLDSDDWITARLAAEPELPLSTIHRELCARGIRVGISSVQGVLKRINM